MSDLVALSWSSRSLDAHNCTYRYEDAVELFKHAIELAKVTQGSLTVWASTYVNLGTALQKTGLVLPLVAYGTSSPILSSHRRLEEARDAYRSVLDLEPRHATALGYLGKTYHLMGDLDAAITKYHEVSPLST